MAIHKRGDVWHYDFTIDGNRYRHSTDQTDRRAALKVESRARERAKLGSGSEIWTLEEAARRWYAARSKGRRSSMTTSFRLTTALRHIDPGLLVTEITTAQIEEAIQSRRYDTTHNGRAPTNATVNRDMIDSTLRPILNYAAEVGEFPIRLIKWTKIRLDEPRSRHRAFTAAELAAWRGALPEWHRATFDFLALYGLRLREAWFPPAWLDVASETLRIDGSVRKNGETLVIPLLPEDAADLAARASRAEAVGLATVWYRDQAGVLTPTDPRGFQSASRLALQRVGIVARPAHDLRHHAGTMIRRFGDVTTAKMLLGHEDIRSTERYAQADFGDVRTALRHAKDTGAQKSPKTPIDSIAVTGT